MARIRRLVRAHPHDRELQRLLHALLTSISADRVDEAEVKAVLEQMESRCQGVLLSTPERNSPDSLGRSPGEGGASCSPPCGGGSSRPTASRSADGSARISDLRIAAEQAAYRSARLALRSCDGQPTSTPGCVRQRPSELEAWARGDIGAGSGAVGAIASDPDELLKDDMPFLADVTYDEPFGDSWRRSGDPDAERGPFTPRAACARSASADCGQRGSGSAEASVRASAHGCGLCGASGGGGCASPDCGFESAGNGAARSAPMEDETPRGSGGCGCSAADGSAQIGGNTLSPFRSPSRHPWGRQRARVGTARAEEAAAARSYAGRMMSSKSAESFSAERALVSAARAHERQLDDARRRHEAAMAELRHKLFREAKQAQAQHEHALASLRKQCEKQLAASAGARRDEQRRAEALDEQVRELSGRLRRLERSPAQEEGRVATLQREFAKEMESLVASHRAELSARTRAAAAALERAEVRGEQRLAEAEARAVEARRHFEQELARVDRASSQRESVLSAEAAQQAEAALKFQRRAEEAEAARAAAEAHAEREVQRCEAELRRSRAKLEDRYKSEVEEARASVSAKAELEASATRRVELLEMRCAELDAALGQAHEAAERAKAQAREASLSLQMAVGDAHSRGRSEGVAEAERQYGAFSPSAASGSLTDQLEAAQQRAAEAEGRAMDAEARADAAETLLAGAEARAASAERRGGNAEARAEAAATLLEAAEARAERAEKGENQARADGALRVRTSDGEGEALAARAALADEEREAIRREVWAEARHSLWDDAQRIAREEAEAQAEARGRESTQVKESVRAEVWQEVLTSARAEAQAQVARHIEQWKSDAAWVGPTASRKQTAEAGTNTDVVARRSVQTSTDVTSASTADSATSTSPWLRRGSITGPESADQLEGSAGQRSHRFPLNTSPPGTPNSPQLSRGLRQAQESISSVRNELRRVRRDIAGNGLSLLAPSAASAPSCAQAANARAASAASVLGASAAADAEVRAELERMAARLQAQTEAIAARDALIAEARAVNEGLRAKAAKHELERATSPPTTRRPSFSSSGHLEVPACSSAEAVVSSSSACSQSTSCSVSFPLSRALSPSDEQPQVHAPPTTFDDSRRAPSEHTASPRPYRSAAVGLPSRTSSPRWGVPKRTAPVRPPPPSVPPPLRVEADAELHSLVSHPPTSPPPQPPTAPAALKTPAPSKGSSHGATSSGNRNGGSNSLGSGKNESVSGEASEPRDKRRSSGHESVVYDVYDRHAPVPPDPAEEARRWIADVCGEPPPESELQEWLKSGIVLCELVNAIEPGIVRRINRSQMPFKQMENIGNYITACCDLGVPTQDLFMTVDLYEGKNMTAVIRNLHSLGRVAQANGFDGPRLGARLSTRHERVFTQEQLLEAKAMPTRWLAVPE